MILSLSILLVVILLVFTMKRQEAFVSQAGHDALLLLCFDLQGDTLSFFDDPPQGNRVTTSGPPGGSEFNLEFIEFSSFQVRIRKGNVNGGSWWVLACYLLNMKKATMLTDRRVIVHGSLWKHDGDRKNWH